VSTDEDLNTTLLAIHSRLGTVEGKVTLVARAERERLLPILRDEVQKKPLIGQIYLVISKALTQDEIKEELARHNLGTSQPTISRRLDHMQTELGIVEVVRRGRFSAYRRNRVMEETLNLTKRTREWLEDKGEAVPAQPTRRRRGGR
jgi:hypothetical protein